MRVLFVVHGFPPRASGGTEIYAHDLARVLRDRFADDVFVFTREADPARTEYAVRRERRDGIDIASVNNTFRACRHFEDSYRHDRIRRVGASFIDEVRPDVAHLHHLTCLSTGLVAELAARRIPVVSTLNDYWLICHRGQLLDVDVRRCAGPSVDGCARCIGGLTAPRAAGWLAPLWRTLERRAPSALAASVRVWGRSAAAALGGAPGARHEAARRLDHMRSLVPLVAQFLAPSRTLLQRYLEFGVPADRLLYQEQGIDQARLRGIERRSDRRLRLGFLGSLMISKAPHLLLEAVAGLPEDAVSVYLFGAVTPYHGDDGYRSRFEPLLERSNVHHAGPVPHERVADVLAALDVLVVPSIWIENAPFVIREAFAAGVPVVASNLGGMGELVTHERSGLLFEPGNADDLRRTIRRLLDEPRLLDRLRAGLPLMKTMEEDAEWTRQVYARHLPAPKRALAGVTPPSVIARRPRLAAVVLNYRTPEDTVLAARAALGSTRPIDDLIVVDNGSSDGSEPFLRESLPGARVLQTGRNLGFADGTNAGIRAALEGGAGLIALVNSDVVAPPHTLARLEEALASTPALGIVGPLICSRSEPTRVASAGIVFSRASGRMRHLDANREMSALTPPPVIDVDGVSGCLMLVRRAVFEHVGLLAVDYFFSFEDLDFCLRARVAGFQSACVTGALAYHEGGLTMGRRSPRRVYFATRNHLALAARLGDGSLPRSLARTAAILGFNLAYVLTSPDVPRVRGLAAFARGALDHFAGRYGAGPSP